MEVARRDVVENRVAEYVIEGARLGDVAAPTSDHHAELDLPVQPRGQALRIRNHLARTDDGRRRFGEVDGRGRGSAS